MAISIFNVSALISRFLKRTTTNDDKIALRGDLGAAPLASPAFTGTPTAPTATGGISNTQIATTAFVANYGTTKAPINSPGFNGSPTAPTPPDNDNSTRLATTAFVANVLGTPNTADFILLLSGQGIPIGCEVMKPGGIVDGKYWYYTGTASFDGDLATGVGFIAHHSGPVYRIQEVGQPESIILTGSYSALEQTTGEIWFDEISMESIGVINVEKFYKQTFFIAPTSDPHVAGAVWNNGTLQVSAG